jgi:hypothetical protein
VERRNRDDGKPAEVTCRSCGALAALDPTKMRLEATRATLPCPACGAEIPVRRADGYRGVAHGVAWTFASYADEPADPAAEAPREPAGVGRLFGRKHRA